jgi:hypothetical protein
VKFAWSRIGTLITLATPFACSLFAPSDGDVIGEDKRMDGGEAGAEVGGSANRGGAPNGGGSTSRGGAPPKPRPSPGGEGGDAGEANPGGGGSGGQPNAGSAGAPSAGSAGAPSAGSAGMATAGASGAGSGCNSPSAECEAAEVATEPRACGACNQGTQTRTRTCSAECRWGAWSAFGACDESAVECLPDHWYCCAQGSWMWCRTSTCTWTDDCDAESCAASQDCDC